MYVVIFRAKVKQLDKEYSETASRMRELAMNQYGCIEFSACMEGMNEIAISYWPTMEHIAKWNDNPEHKAAQELGKSKWYSSHQVQVTKIIREYGKIT